MRKPKSTAAELRSNIDRGLTGDKIAMLDPAAAPLGTDDEAAGIRSDPEILAEVRDRELEAGAWVREAERSREGTEADGALPWIMIAAFLLALLAMIWLAAAYI